MIFGWGIRLDKYSLNLIVGGMGVEWCEWICLFCVGVLRVNVCLEFFMNFCGDRYFIEGNFCILLVKFVFSNLCFVFILGIKIYLEICLKM